MADGRAPLPPQTPKSTLIVPSLQPDAAATQMVP